MKKKCGLNKKNIIFFDIDIQYLIKGIEDKIKKIIKKDLPIKK